MSDVEFERRVAAALHAPVTVSDGSRERIMRRVREAAASGAPRRRVPRTVRPARHSLVGLAMAASVGSVAVLSVANPRNGVHETRPNVIGDSVVATLRDTLRLVRLIFDDPGARRVAVVGDFNAWQPEANPLERQRGSRHWSTVVALRDGNHRYAFVVDGARWVTDPATPTVRDGARLVSLLHVTRASN